MPIACPDSAVLTAWRNAMAITGVLLLLLVALAVRLLLRARPAGWLAGWLARSLSAVSVALNMVVGAASLVLAYQLNGEFAGVARWFAGYPHACVLPRSYPYRGYVPAIEAAARQAVEPLERAAQVDLALAVVAIGALVACTLVWGSKRRVR